MGKLELALTIAGLAFLSINPAYTQGENNLNLLLCAVMCVSPMVLLLRNARVVIPRIDFPFLLVCFFVLTMPFIFHPESVRLSTMFFTCAYCVFMMMLARTLRLSGMNAEIFMKVIRVIIYAFAGVLVIQQICLLMGWPIFNEGVRYTNAPYRLNSLTAEPSHSTVTLCALMFFYTQTFRIAHPHTPLYRLLLQRWPMWLCWAWVIFSTSNASAFLLAPLCLFPFITRRNAPWTVTLGVLAIVVIFVSPIGDFYHINRIRSFTEALMTGDEKIVMIAEPSAGDRILPGIRGAKSIFPIDAETFIGHGVDADQNDFTPKFANNKGFAGFFSMWHNYGALCAIALWWAIGTLILVKKKPCSILAFLFALQMSADYNMQLVWVIMGFGMTFKYAVCGDRKLLAIYSCKWRKKTLTA